MRDREPLSPYESWVVTLRIWADDPTTPLTHLPILTEESLPQEAYARFIEHLQRALERSAQQWEKAFSTAISNFRDHHDLADRLVKQRAILARRLQLASHPSLPEPVRAALTDDFERMVNRLQDEFESNTRDAMIRRRLPQPAVEQLMRTIRENSLVAVLRLSITQDGTRATLTPLPETGIERGVQTAPPRRRRALLPD